MLWRSTRRGVNFAHLGVSDVERYNPTAPSFWGVFRLLRHHMWHRVGLQLSVILTSGFDFLKLSLWRRFRRCSVSALPTCIKHTHKRETTTNGTAERRGFPNNVGCIRLYQQGEHNNGFPRRTACMVVVVVVVMVGASTQSFFSSSCFARIFKVRHPRRRTPRPPPLPHVETPKLRYPTKLTFKNTGDKAAMTRPATTIALNTAWLTHHGTSDPLSPPPPNSLKSWRVTDNDNSDNTNKSKNQRGGGRGKGSPGARGEWARKSCLIQCIKCARVYACVFLWTFYLLPGPFS